MVYVCEQNKARRNGEDGVLQAKNDVWRVIELRNGVRIARKEMEKEAKTKRYFKRKKNDKHTRQVNAN